MLATVSKSGPVRARGLSVSVSVRSALDEAAASLDTREQWLWSALRKSAWSETTLRCVERYLKDCEARGRNLTVSGVLQSLGLLTAAQLADLLAEHLGWRIASAQERSSADEAGLRAVGAELGRRLGVAVLRSGDGAPRLAVVDPRRLLTPEGRSLLLQLNLSDLSPADLRIISPSDLELLYDRAKEAPDGGGLGVAGRRLIDELLREAVQDDASDIHFVPRERALEVRYRIDGRLWTKHLFPLDRKEEILANAKIAGGLDIGRRGEPLDGAGAVTVGSRQFKLRYSSMPCQFGQQVVVRLLDQEATALPLEDLGLSSSDQEQVLAALAEPQGLIFLVGPTGSGKSTTLASLLSHLDGQAFSIRTLENPIEYRLPNAVQSEVCGDMTFATGLRALLRQDPDYILVGETRDLETAEISVEAGLTGHMCLSTLHANDAIGGIVRLLDLGVEVGPLLASCRLFVGQRLVRRLCRRCARPREDSAACIERLGLRPSPSQQLWEPAGCAYCRDGYKGRIGLYEVRSVLDYESLIQAEGTACGRACRSVAADRGLATMRSDGMAKALQGLTTIEEVLSQAPA